MLDTLLQGIGLTSIQSVLSNDPSLYRIAVRHLAINQAYFLMPLLTTG